MKSQFNIIRKDGETILKVGRKIYAKISYNTNPDYKWMLCFNTFALSGYETEQKAIERAERMNNECNAAFENITNFKN